MLSPAHPDHEILATIENALAGAVGREKIEAELPLELRRALDEVVDTEPTGRVWISELEKTEKTYIGTKVEIVVRAYFSLPKGRLDLRIADYDVDVKNTIGKTWMIPREAVGSPCILLSQNDEKSACSCGLIVAKDAYLTGGANQDGKRSISAAGREHIWWLFKGAPMPSFWSSIDRSLITKLMDPAASGTERIRRLFANVQNQPISRETVRAVARQKDYMKRLRKNGGARDPLEQEGIVVLGGTFGSNLIGEFGLPECARDEFISFAPNQDQLDRLKKEGLVD